MSGHVIEPLAAALNPYAARMKRIETLTRGKTPFSGDLQLLIDGRTPYRLLSEVLHTATLAGFVRPSLITLAAHQPFKRRLTFGCVTIGSSPPPVARATTNPSDPRRTPVPLNVTVTVAHWSEAQDFPGLGRLATRLKGKHPSERTVVVAAETTISLQTVIRALDALRGAQGHPLFDRPVLSVGPE